MVFVLILLFVPFFWFLFLCFLFSFWFVLFCGSLPFDAS